MRVNGWALYQHELFRQQMDRLVSRVDALKKRDPAGYQNLPATKLLATIHRYIEEIIPKDPAAAVFRQGNTLGVDNRHWFRAKFHERYRLFYRFSGSQRIILYVWVNDEGTLRKAGAKTDPYTVFRSMLEAGNPPGSIEELLRRSSELVARTMERRKKGSDGQR